MAGIFRLRKDLIEEQKFDTPCNCEGRTEEMHPCPFQEEIWDQHEDSCNCCDDCSYECMLDI
jgi:hypothetical protein